MSVVILVLVGFLILKSAEVIAKPQGNFSSRGACSAVKALSVFTILVSLLLGVDSFMVYMGSVNRSLVNRTLVSSQDSSETPARLTPEQQRSKEKNAKEIEELMRKAR